MSYMTVKEVAIMLGLTVQAIYQAIGKKNLKCKKIEGIKYTTQEWLEEYRKFLHSKQKHSRYNGKHVFDESRGFYSVQMVADMLGIRKHFVYDMISEGKIQCLRRGNYKIVLKEEFEKVKESIIERACKSA